MLLQLKHTSGSSGTAWFRRRLFRRNGAAGRIILGRGAKFASKEFPGSECADRHSDSGDLFDLVFRGAGLPRNCESEVRSGITPCCQRSAERHELLRFVVKGPRTERGIKGFLKLLHRIIHLWYSLLMRYCGFA